MNSFLKIITSKTYLWIALSLNVFAVFITLLTFKLELIDVFVLIANGFCAIFLWEQLRGKTK